MKDYVNILQRSELFGGIKEEDLLPLLSCLSAKQKHYEKGQTVVLSGESVSSFGLVLSGQIQVSVEDYYGNRTILAQDTAGSLFGESYACAYSNSNNSAFPFTVTAVADSDILFIDCNRLSSPCTNACGFHKKLIQNLLGIVSKKNIALTQKIEFTSKRTTREKLLAYLSSEAQRAGSSRFAIPFNRQELADYLSVDRSAMSTELGRLRDEGVLKFNKNRFELL
jgi:CRP-like cAMP-binding protein